MKKILFFLILIVFPLLGNAFTGKAKVGGIWYNIITKAQKAEVTSEYPIQHYKGRIVIPRTIVYEGVTCTVTAIGDGAFAQSEVMQIVIPNTVKSIGKQAFKYCDNLKSITIPESVESIGSYAFDGCYELKALKLPSKLESIDEALFQKCYQLVSVDIPANVTSIGSYAFKGCRGLKSIKISDKVEKIGFEAFKECESLTNVIIPDNLIKVEMSSFSGCKSLQSITLGNKVEKIESNAFENCGDLKSFYITRNILPYIVNNSEIFRNSEIEYATLYVPESVIEDFKITSPWNKFGKIVSNPNIKNDNSTITSQFTEDENLYEPHECKGDFPTPHIPRYKLQQWLEENAICPEAAKAKGIYGSVTVNFVVEKDGSISNVKATNGNQAELVPEAERVIRNMPKWKPGKINGKYVRVWERETVRFPKQ